MLDRRSLAALRENTYVYLSRWQLTDDIKACLIWRRSYYDDNVVGASRCFLLDASLQFTMYRQLLDDCGNVATVRFAL